LGFCLDEGQELLDLYILYTIQQFNTKS
jgi:hypothetical protein